MFVCLFVGDPDITILIRKGWGRRGRNFDGLVKACLITPSAPNIIAIEGEYCTINFRKYAHYCNVNNSKQYYIIIV